MPYNKLLTNLACSNRTGEYWPSVVFVRTSLRSVRTATTSGQYPPVRPSRSVSKRLILNSTQLLCWHGAHFVMFRRMNTLIRTTLIVTKPGKECHFGLKRIHGATNSTSSTSSANCKFAYRNRNTYLALQTCLRLRETRT